MLVVEKLTITMFRKGDRVIPVSKYARWRVGTVVCDRHSWLVNESDVLVLPNNSNKPLIVGRDFITRVGA